MKAAYLASLLLPAAAAIKPGNLNLARMPGPTPAPEPYKVAPMLEKRAVGSDTCGWINSILTDSATCNLGYQCATNAYYNAFGCCSGDLASCTLFTTCLESTRALAALTTADGFSLLCISAASPSCHKYTFPGGYSGWGCGILPSVVSVATAVGTVRAGGVLSSVAVTGPVVAATASSNPAAPVQTVIEQSSSSSGGGLSTGAIVGIAIAGAVVAIVAICVIGFLCYKRNKRQKAEIVPQPQFYPNQPPQGNGNGTTEVWGKQGPMSQVGTSQVGSQGNHTSTYGGTTVAGGHQSPVEIADASQVGSQTGSHNAPTQLNQNNMNAHLAQHGASQNPNEWGFMGNRVQQQQSAAADNDGINVVEIMPEEAVDERIYQQQPPQPQQYQAGAGGHFVPPQHPGSPAPTQMSGTQMSSYPGAQQGQPTNLHPSRPNDVMSTMAPTAMEPTVITHNFRPV